MLESPEQNEPIEVRPEDILAHLSEIGEPKDAELICLDLDKNIWVRLGIPVEEENRQEDFFKIAPEDAPNEPYVFMAHQLVVSDPKHDHSVLENVPVIFAHGERINGQWVFGNGQSVVETVNAWDKYASEHSLPKIEFILACNRERRSQPQDIEVKISDFPSQQIIAQAVGFSIGLSGRYYHKGKISFQIRSYDEGEFFGLDELITYKQTELL